MNHIQLIPLQNTHRPAYEALYESAFPASERKPLDYMLEGDKSAAYEVWQSPPPTVPWRAWSSP